MLSVQSSWFWIDGVDVFTTKGWERHGEERRLAAERNERAMEHNSDSEVEIIPPRTMVIFLRSSATKLRLKVADVPSPKSRVLLMIDGHYWKADERVSRKGPSRGRQKCSH
jgi:hypothetical protein